MMRTMPRWGRRGALMIAATLIILVAVTAVYGYAFLTDQAPGQYVRPESAEDVTGRFTALLGEDGQLDAAAIDAAFRTVGDRLRGTRVVIVPSYLVDQLRPARELGLVDYFSDQQQWLESLGVETMIAPTDTEASVTHNAGILVDLVADSDRPVCFISHSKGGLDTLAALIRMSPAQRGNVRCWLAFQAPFAGSPLADLAADAELFRLVADSALEFLGGSGQSLDDLTTPVRQRYLQENDAAIRHITADVPILAVTTRLLPRDDWLATSPFAPSRRWMDGQGIPSDGVVPTASAILPHARYVVIEGLDHGDTFDGERPFTGALFNDIVFLKALLGITLGPGT